MRKGKKIGLSLSGGGYRASAYHIGTIRKLKEMGILQDLDVISSNSGGSITAATYSLHKNDFDRFEKTMIKGIKSSVIGGILKSVRFLIPIVLFLILFCASIYFMIAGPAWISTVILFVIILALFIFQYAIFPLSRIIESIYNKLFFNNAKLKDLTSTPKLVINSTNVETGRLFTFARDKMSDSSYQFPDNGKPSISFKQKEFPIARAVAASTCVPFAFSPVTINGSYFKNKADVKRARPRLVDGGVYDNQGIHKLAFKGSSYACDTIIISDAGNVMPFKNSYWNVLGLLIRVSDIFMNRIKNFQMMQLLYIRDVNENREVAYQSLGCDLEQSIPEYIRSMKNNQIMSQVWKSHGIRQSDIDNNEWDKIEGMLKKSVGYEDIIIRANSKEITELTRSVSTNLVPLSEDEQNGLINHAYLMTELQIKLYCPTLLTQ